MNSVHEYSKRKRVSILWIASRAKVPTHWTSVKGSLPECGDFLPVQVIGYAGQGVAEIFPLAQIQRWLAVSQPGIPRIALFKKFDKILSHHVFPQSHPVSRLKIDF
jgi:hypothetical protein